MSEEHTIRDIPDWAEALSRADAPISNRFAAFMPDDFGVPIGGVNRYGQTLMGYTEVDEAAREQAEYAWADADDRLAALYHKQGFLPTDDPGAYGYWEPIQTDESRALAEEVDRLRSAFLAHRRQPIWDPPKRLLPHKVEWGLRKPE